MQRAEMASNNGYEDVAHTHNGTLCSQKENEMKAIKEKWLQIEFIRLREINPMLHFFSFQILFWHLYVLTKNIWGKFLWVQTYLLSFRLLDCR